MKLTRDVEYIIEKIESSGFAADVVGGPVRDFLLGKAPFDYDITTSAHPDEIKKIFSDGRTVDTGIKHGTVTLVLNGECYEITTYRIDGEYLDSRHPESVSFTDSLKEDLARRDFTMNAISYNPKRGITDPFFGREDIEGRLIRAVGVARRRFEEDALRILRGARFAATLGFSVEEETRAAMTETAHLLSRIAAERIYTEWKKLLSGEFAYRALTEFSDVISVFLPELNTLNLPDASRFLSADFHTRQLALFYLSCKDFAPGDFDAAMRRLKTDKATRETGVTVLSSVGKYDSATSQGRQVMLATLGDADIAQRLVSLEVLLGITDSVCERALASELSSGIPYRISDLKIGGEELASLGFCGREIGKILKRLLFAVANGEAENTKEGLVSFVAQNK